MSKLSDHKIAILATHGYEQSELEHPLAALKDAGAEVHVISPESGEIKGWSGDGWGQSVTVDLTLDEANPSDYHALVLPGGQINPDILRVNAQAISFIQSFWEAKKPIGAICHAPWLLIEAGIAKGRKMTAYHSIKTDVINAGAQWHDSQVVCDQALVTSRNPDDLPAFCDKMIEEIVEGKHLDRAA